MQPTIPPIGKVGKPNNNNITIRTGVTGKVYGKSMNLVGLCSGVPLVVYNCLSIDEQSLSGINGRGYGM